MGGFEEAIGQAETGILRLADGSEVHEAALGTTMLALVDLMRDYGALAAVDLRGLVEGRQPIANPFADMKSVLVGIGICTKAEDGSLLMHDSVADIVRNSVHVNPRDLFDCRLVDPREPFVGFEA